MPRLIQSSGLDRVPRRSDEHDLAVAERDLLVGLGGAGSGASFRATGASYRALVHGATRWFLFPPLS